MHHGWIIIHTAYTAYTVISFKFQTISKCIPHGQKVRLGTECLCQVCPEDFSAQKKVLQDQNEGSPALTSTSCYGQWVDCPRTHFETSKTHPLELQRCPPLIVTCRAS